ncbi:IS110 family transposase [Paenibacillus chondroitinus]|uniref:IS110 family transposase n=1 Tax=Paenibacillus chondroitinus TaxID=59842 RepID=A0ABU6DN03_9BACL|nr:MULTISPECIES: IS110 family transposase [Paenibacillus]MCY9663368.1 IS110 family transposase [Paenibacillus anseongense]MEB4799159.1 IS110 family transposase [Paenibacillus chondroitinus]
MKFKEIDAQNQRVEQITTSHLVIGIDMAKEIHVAQATNFRGLVVSKRHLSFSNSVEGFEKLSRWMSELLQKHRLNRLIIGMEPTGHYWFNLANWLTDKNLHVVMVNPATTKRNKENRDNSPSKNDPKDALTIADSVSRGFYYEYTRQSHEFQRLKTLMSDREFWVTNSVRLQNRIVRWLDIRFPEYPSVFKDWTCKRSLATLKTFPCPQDLEKHTVADVLSAWRVHMQRAGGTTGTEKAALLIAQAKRSVGERVAVDEAKADLKRLIEEFERVTSMLEQIEKDIEALLSEIPMAQQLRTIKGLGKIFTAAILAGTGDLRQYAHGRQVLRKAGLNLAQSKSGKRKGQIVLSKRGDSTLRKYLYLATVQLVWNNPVFRHLHEHNVHEKMMKKQQSIFKLIGKLARILVGIVQRGEEFTPEKTVLNWTEAA